MEINQDEEQKENTLSIYSNTFWHTARKIAPVPLSLFNAILFFQVMVIHVPTAIRKLNTKLARNRIHTAPRECLQQFSSASEI